MPIINVKLLEGRSDEQLKDLVSEVTNGYTCHRRRNETRTLRCGRSQKSRSVIKICTQLMLFT